MDIPWWTQPLLNLFGLSKMSIDLFDITDNSYKTQVFYQSGTWVKPRGITMVSFFVVGAGGGGGRGANLATNLGNYGGGGGGGGAVSRLLIPAIFLKCLLISEYEAISW